MAGLTIEQQRALALSRARARAQSNSALESEVQAKAAPALPSHADTIKDYSYAGKVANSVVNPSGLTTGVAKGIANAGMGALQTANAVGHSIGGYLGEKYDEYAPSVGLSPRDPASVQAASDQASREQKMFQDAEFKPQTKEDQIWMPVGQVGGAIAAGGGVGSGVSKALASGSSALAGEGALAATGRYLAGAVAAAPIAAAPFPTQEGLIVNSHGYLGIRINPDDDPATQQSKKFLNQAFDNMILGAAGDVAYAGGRKLTEFSKNIINGLITGRKFSSIKQGHAESLLSIFAGQGEHATDAEKRAAAEQAIKYIDEHGLEAVDFGEGVGKKTIKKDTISTLNSGLGDDPFSRAVKTRMEALRSSAKRGNAPKTSSQLEEPKRVLDQGLQETQAVRGGDQAIDQTKQVLQDRAQTQAAQLDVPVQTAKDDLVKQSSDFTDTLKNDPTFGPAIKDADAGGIPLDINAKERELKGAIVRKAGVAQETDKALRDAAYKAVGDSGAPAKMDEFMDVYNEYESVLPENIKQLVGRADGSYGYLYKNVRGALSKAIGIAKDSQNSAALDGLYSLKRNIDHDQIAWLTENGNEQTIAAARNAAKVNSEYSAKWNDTIGQELRVNKTNNKWSPGSLQEKGRDIVDSAVSNPNRKESIENLKTILGPDEGLVADTALAKATKDITAGKGANIDNVTSDLQQMANSFGPKQKARLEGFLTDLKSKKISIEELQKKIPELEKAADMEKEEIFGKKFPDLFETVTGKKVPKGNGYAVFQKAMDAEQPRVIDALIAEARKNPEDMVGLETAWLKSADDKINPPGRKYVGNLDERFVENGKKIFGENSPEIKAITGLRDKVEELQNSLNKPGMEGLSATKAQSQARTAISAVSTWVFGVLNPTAAKVRTLTNNLAETYNLTDKSHKAIDDLLSDNQDFKKTMEELILKYKTRLSPQAWRTAWKEGAKLGLYGLRGQTELNFDKK